MKIQDIEKKLRDYLQKLKKESFSTHFARKKSVSTLEKLLFFFILGLGFIFTAVFLIILPKVEEVLVMKTEIQSSRDLLYDKEGKRGLETQFKQKDRERNLAQEQFDIEKSQEIERLNNAILEDLDTYKIINFLEDYTITMNTEGSPLILMNISFSKMKTVDILPKDFLSEENKDIKTPVEYRVLPFTVDLDASKEKLEQFLEFIYHSGDTKSFYFKGEPVPIMSIESLSLPIEDKEEEKISESYSLKLNVYFQKEDVLQKQDPKKKN